MMPRQDFAYPTDGRIRQKVCRIEGLQVQVQLFCDSRIRWKIYKGAVLVYPTPFPVLYSNSLVTMIFLFGMKYSSKELMTIDIFL